MEWIRAVQIDWFPNKSQSRQVKEPSFRTEWDRKFPDSFIKLRVASGFKGLIMARCRNANPAPNAGQRHFPDS